MLRSVHSCHSLESVDSQLDGYSDKTNNNNVTQIAETWYANANNDNKRSAVQNGEIQLDRKQNRFNRARINERWSEIANTASEKQFRRDRGVSHNNVEKGRQLTQIHSEKLGTHKTNSLSDAAKDRTLKRSKSDEPSKRSARRSSKGSRQSLFRSIFRQRSPQKETDLLNTESVDTSPPKEVPTKNLEKELSFQKEDVSQTHPLSHTEGENEQISNSTDVKNLQLLSLKNIDLQQKLANLEHQLRHLEQQNSHLELQNRNKEAELEVLSKHVQGLEKSIEASKNKVEIARKVARERDSLRKYLKTSHTDAENMELEIAFLQEEKRDAEDSFKKLTKEFQYLQKRFRKSEKERTQYRDAMLGLIRRTEKAINDVCSELCDVLDHNRYLIRNGLKGKPKDFQKILKVTDEYLVLQGKKNRLQSQLHKYTSKLVTQELYITDLKIELASAVNQLMKEGIHYESRLIGRVPKFIADLRNDPKSKHVTLHSKKNRKRLRQRRSKSKSPKDAENGSSRSSTHSTGSGSKSKPTLGVLFQDITGMKDHISEKIFQPMESFIREGAQDIKDIQDDVKATATKEAAQAVSGSSVAKNCCKQACACCK